MNSALGPRGALGILGLLALSGLAYLGLRAASSEGDATAYEGAGGAAPPPASQPETPQPYRTSATGDGPSVLTDEGTLVVSVHDQFAAPVGNAKVMAKPVPQKKGLRWRHGFTSGEGEIVFELPAGEWALDIWDPGPNHDIDHSEQDRHVIVQPGEVEHVSIGVIAWDPSSYVSGEVRILKEDDEKFYWRPEHLNENQMIAHYFTPPRFAFKLKPEKAGKWLCVEESTGRVIATARLEPGLHDLVIQPK